MSLPPEMCQLAPRQLGSLHYYQAAQYAIWTLATFRLGDTLRMENYRFGYLAEFVDPQSYGSRVRVGMGSSCYNTNCSNSLGLKDI